MEVFSSYHDEEMTRWFLKKAKEHQLLITGGSDYHGKIKPNIELSRIDYLGQEEEVKRVVE